MRNKKVAVTGGLGFIGSHLVERLCQENEVVIVDNETTGSIKNIKHLDFSNISLDLGDITEIDLVNSFEGCDYVFHHAAMASVPASVADPIQCNLVNITGTLKVLLAARDSGVKKVVFASSAAVYGDNTNLPLSESTPLKPVSPYALSKAVGEMYCQLFADIYELPTIALRYFNVFGPRQDPNSQYASVIPHFISRILKGERPVIFGDGEQSRDFIYVKHIVEANLRACLSDYTGAYNIATGKRTTINQLVPVINQTLGKNMGPIYEEPRPGDIKHSLADVSKAEVLNFKPSINFADELGETVQWFVKNQ
ncbi:MULTISPECIES: SDR family oxidoreductase [Methanobacterium]|uniref:UDP-glucose 4-epimerase n=1 Tax=Methanobacterium formicicum TaxID=2162 RepID=A0A090I4H9_METFO|nr:MULTISPECIES: SDR family oxidoreductase [Methanobacterium]AXV39240.1 MAG: GDP-mannose 4,6-dehydratase [Methanobacterium sp. BAmetb5]MDH2659457.1 SDR family oxidoreductase [Methanobacterium formicicum]CEA14323.1 UDP-glucose 4-epimerase [Methanobacterium formicicum]